LNASIAILGLAMLAGSALIFSEFSFSEHRRERAAAIAGFACLALGGLGAILVGFVLEMPILLICTRWELPWQSALVS
jgi:predicted benzoate:H+ symporter BenE